MTRSLRKFLYGFFLVSAHLLPIIAFTQVTVVPATTTSGVKICEKGGSVTLTDIKITEGLPDDIGNNASDHPGVTLILEAPTGFNFVNGAGAASAKPGGDVSNVSINWTLTNVTITLDAINSLGPNALDELTISGLQLLAISGTPKNSANITLSASSTVSVNGLSIATIFGTFSSTANTALAVSVNYNTVCPNQGVNVTVVSSETGINYEVFDGASSLSSSFAGTGSNLIIPTLSISAVAALRTLKVVATDGSAGCSTELQQQQNVTVVSTPTANAGGSNEVCYTTGSYTFSTATAANGTIAWTHNGQGSFDNNSLLHPTYTFNFADAGSVVTFTLTVTGGGSCAPVSDTFALTITTPPQSTGGTAEVCHTAGTYQITTATSANGTFVWTHNGQGTLNNNSIINPTYTFDAADKGTVVTFTLTTTSAGSCSSANANFVLTITAPPTANAGSDEEICFGGTFNFNSQATPATAGNYSTVSWITTGTGTLNNANTLIPNYIPAINESGLITFAMTSHRNGSCGNVTDQMVLNIHAKPSFTVSNTTSVPFCSGGSDAITLNSSSPGAIVQLVTITPSDPGVTGFTSAGATYNSFPFTIADNLTNSTTSVQTLVYEFEVSVAGCANPVHKTATVTVRPIPNLTVTNNIASPICSGSSTNIDLTDPTSGVVITVTNISISPAASGITGYSAVNSTFANGSKVTNVLVNNTSVQQAITYTFRSSANGCSDPSVETATVIVEPSPVFTLTNSAASICSGGNTNIQLGSTSSGAVVTLVNVTPSDAGLTGFDPISTTYTTFASPISNTLTNATTGVQTVVYEFEVSVAGCVNPVHKTSTVTVRPIPNLTVTNNIASPICSGGSTNIDLTDPTSGVVITVTAISISPTPGGVTGYSPVNSTFANGSKVTNVLVNNTSVQQTISYTFRSSANGCNDPSLETATVVVEPSPVFSLTNSSASICSGGITNIQVSSTAPSAVIELVSVTPSNAGVTGFTTAPATYSSPFPVTISDVLTNATASVQTVVYEFQVRVAGCVSPVHKTTTITINPTPALSITNNAPTIASGKNTNIDLFDATNGVVIKLEAVSTTDPSVSGYSSVGSTFANGSKVTDVLINSTSTPQDVIYSFRSSANGCADSNLVDVTVTINPGGVFAVTNGSPQICSGSATNLTINSPTAGATVKLVSVTPSNAGITGFAAAGTVYSVFPHVITNALTNPTNAPETVVYEFEVSVSGTPNPVHEFATVRINPVPALTITNTTSSICSGVQTDIAFTSPTSSALITLASVTPGGVTGNSPAGTTFASGSHLRDVLSNLTSSTVIVTYNFNVSANGCSLTGFATAVTVAPSPDFTVTNHVPSICSTGGQNIDLTTSVNGAKITVTGVTISPAAGGVTGVLVANTQYTSSFPGTQTLTGSLVNTTNVVQTVTYEFEMSAGSCVNPVRQTVNIMVSPTPSMTITNTTSSICSGNSTSITLNSATSGAIITLTNVNYGGANGSLSSNTTYTPGSVINDVLYNPTSAPVAVAYIFEVSANGCATGSFGTSVTVAPTLNFTVTNHANSFCSSGSQNIDLTTTVSGAKITITGVTISPTAGSVTGVLTAGTPYTSSFPGTETLTGSLVNTSNTVQTVTYEFEMSNGSCVNPTRQTASVVVYPSPSMSITNTTSSICSEGYSNITLNSPTSGAIITLTSVVYGGVTGSSSNNTTYTPGSLISELLQNTTPSPVTVTYTFEVSANGCTATGYTTTIVVNPNPDFTVTNGSAAICNGGQTNISFTSTTTGHQINVVSVNYGAVTGGTVVPGTTVYTNGNGITETLTNNTNAPIDVVYTFNVTTPGTTPVCPVTPLSKQVIVRVQPELLFTYTNAAPTICSGTQANITLLTSVTSSQLRLTAVNYNGANGSLSAGLVYANNQKIAETLVNNTTSPITVSYTIESSIGACTSVTSQVIQVIVNPIPKLSSTLAPAAICSGTTFSYAATSPTPGAGFNWSRAAVAGISQSAASGSGDVNEVLTNTTSFPINVTYVYVTDANGCNNNPGQNVVVTVNPGPSLGSTLSAAPMCSGNSFIYTATSATSGAIFNWSRASVAGIIQSANSGTGNVSEVLTNTTSSPVVVTYVYVVSANGCSNTPGQSVTVTVQPVPLVIDPADQVICNGTTTTLVDFASTGVGTSYNWVNDTPSIGLPSSGTDNIASFNTVNTGSAPVIATLTVIPYYNTCVGASQSFTITVNPAPTLNVIANQVVCTTFSTTAIMFSGVATTYDWVNNNNTIGLATSGIGVTGIPAFTATNSGSTTQVATVTVTPKYVNGAVTCIGANRTFTITVNPIPDVAASNQDICSGQITNVLISNPGGVSGTTYSWTIGIVTGTVSGYSANSGTVISQVLTSTAGGSVEYIITPSANGCIGASISRIVSVYSVPVGNNIVAGTHVVCSGTTLNIIPTSNVGSATYTWSGSNGSGGNGAITDTPLNTTNAPIDITYTVIPKGPTPTFCNGSSFTITVTVNPNPSFTITNTTSVVCSGVTPAISVTSPTSGAVIALQNVNYGALTNGAYSAGGSFGAGGSLVEGNLINTTSNSIVVTYTFSISTSTTPSCPLVPSMQTTTVTVQPSPSFTINNITPSICSGSKADITLNTPVAGGQVRLKSVTYGAVSGTLIAGAVYNDNQKINEVLSNATNSPVTVQYEFEAISGACVPGASSITNVTVNPNPSFSITNSSTSICSGTSPAISVASPTSGAVIVLQNVSYGALTNGAYPSGGTFGIGGSLVEGNLVNATNNAIVVIYTFSVSTPTSPSCPLSLSTQSTAVIVQPAPSFTLTNTTSSICSGSKTDITLNIPVSGGQIRLKTVTYGAVSGSLSAGAIFNNGQKITETLLNTTNAPVNVQYEFESIVGSCGPGASSITNVNVNPNPGFAITNSSAVICSGTSPSVSVVSPTSGAVIALQNVNYGALTNGAYSAGGTFGTGGSLVEGNLVNNTNNAIVVTYTFSVSTPTSPSCPLSVSTQSTTVTVQPTPSFTLANTTPSICSGSKTDITLNTPVSGGQIRLKTVTYGAVSGSLSAGAIFNNGQKIVETLSNTTNSPVTVQYEFESIVGSCGPGASTITNVTVNPNPGFTITNSSAAICSGASPSVSVVSPTSGSVISLQNVNYGALANGAYSSGGTFGTGGSLVEGSLVNNTNNSIVVTYTFSVSTPTSPSCPLSVSTQSTTVTVQPTPSFTLANTTPSICSGSKTDITLNTPVSGGQIRLKSVIYGGVTGSLTAGAIYVNGQKILETLSNSTNSPITVQYEFESMVGLCGPSAATTTSVTVNPNPSFSITNTTDAICSGTSPSISVTSPTSGAVIALQNVNYGALTNGVYGSGGTFGMGATLAEGNLTNTTSNSIVVTYTFRVTTPTTPSCPLTVTTQTTTVKVDPIPTVVFFGLPTGGPPPQVAENNPTFKVFGNQKGGLFTISPGIGLGSTIQNPTDEAVFDPDAATIYDGHPSTLNTITYTYTNETGCTNSSSQSIIVNAITDIDFGIEGATQDISGYYNLCAELGQVKLLGFPSYPANGLGSNFESLNAGLTIKSDGTNYFIETTGLAAGTYDIKYTFTNAANATSIKIRTVKIFASPLAKFITSNNCIVSDVVFTNQSTVNNAFGATITGWQWNFGDGDVSTAENPSKRYTKSDTYLVTLRVTTNEGCANTSGANEHPLRVGDVPEVNYDWSAICTNDFTNFVDKTTKVVGSPIDPGISEIISYTWDFGDGDILSAGIGNVPAGSNNNRTLGTYKDPKHNYQVNGVYDAVLTVSTNDGCTNSKLKKVSILPGGEIAKPTELIPYQKDFEASAAGWIAEPQTEGANASWIWGVPSGLTIKSAASGSKAWWTGKNQITNNEVTYYNLEHSVVNGPCFDLTSLDRPMVSLDYWSDSEKDVDGAVLQYSTNGGIDWVIVGPAPGLADRDQGIQWFNSAAIISNPGTQPIGPYGWSNRLGKWINGRFNLDIIPASSRSQVRLRVAFSSNDGNVTTEGQTFDGFAFDNFFVGEKQRNVLIEHFTDSQLQATGDSYIDKLQSDQLAAYTISDFNDIRYHISSSSTPDPLAQDNQADPGARATYMGVSRPPTTLMDGILDSKFTGKFEQINLIELDRRALKDPAFDLDLTVVPTIATNTIKVNLKITAKAAHSDPLIVQVVLIENSVGTFRNVLRKALFGSDGQTLSNSFVAGQAVTLSNTNDEINVPIVNSDQLSLVAYVQNKNTREIYQSIKIAAPSKTGRVIVGLEEEVIPTTLNGITIYPNPANNVFNFGIPDQNTTQGYSWKLSDQRGVIVRSGDFENSVNGKKQVDVSGLPNAVYFVIITGPGHSAVYRKLVILNSN